MLRQCNPKRSSGSTTFRARQSRRAAIEAFFLEHLGQRFSTSSLHERFGPAFRTRVSEINRAPKSAIRILNVTGAGKDVLGQPCERSVYWAELLDSAAESEKLETPKPERSRQNHPRLPLFDAAVRG